MEDAKKEANEALKIDSSSLEAKLVRGTISLWQKNFAEAEKDFQNAIYQKPNEVAASNNLALALCEQDDQAKKNRALQYAETNVRQYSQSPDTASTLAWCLYKAGQVPQADEWIRKTMQFSGGNWKEDALFYAAQIGYDSGRKEQSKQELDLLLKSDRPFMMRPEAKLAEEDPRRGKEGQRRQVVERLDRADSSGGGTAGYRRSRRFCFQGPYFSIPRRAATPC